MSLQRHTHAPSFPLEALALESYPTGISALTGWLQTLPPLPVRSDRARLGETLRARIRLEEAMARAYRHAQRAVVDHGTWREGPSLQALQRLEMEEQSHARRLRETCADLGVPSDGVPRLASPLLVAVLGVERLLERSLLVGLQALALAEVAEGTGWGALASEIKEAGLGELADELGALASSEREHLSCLQRWVAHAPA